MGIVGMGGIGNVHHGGQGIWVVYAAVVSV